MLGVSTVEESTQRWNFFSHYWQSYNKSIAYMQTLCIPINDVFASCSKEDKIYPLTTAEIAKAQQANTTLKHPFKCNVVLGKGLKIKLIENTTCAYKDGQLVIPKPLQACAVMWYQQFLQHRGHTRLNETMNTAMYWKGMLTTIRSISRSCKTCQTNKRRKLKYGHLPPKTVISTPWECLYVNLIGPYTLKDRDSLQIDFMALTMICPASSWLEIVKLPLVNWLQRQTVNSKELLTNKIFDKSSDCLARLVNKTWLCRYPQCC